MDYVNSTVQLRILTFLLGVISNGIEKLLRNFSIKNRSPSGGSQSIYLASAGVSPKGRTPFRVKRKFCFAKFSFHPFQEQRPAK
jgi:hypothetical protein